MDDKQYSAITRIMWASRIRIVALPLLMGLGVVCAMTAYRLNLPVSQAETTCTLVRWTINQTKLAQAHWKIAYCDLSNGQTIMATASTNWQPPLSGTVLRLKIETTTYGRHYSVIQ